MHHLLAIAMAITAACSSVAAQSEAPCPAPGAAWTMHTISSIGTGADGVHMLDVNGDGLLDVTTPWEQSNEVSVSIHPGYALSAQPWPTVVVGAASSPEDSRLVDIDGDGAVDVISAGESKRIYVHFAPTDPGDYLTANEWTTITVDAATNVMRWLQLDAADMDEDGRVDIVAGGRLDEPEGILWFGTATPRVAASWVKHDVVNVYWLMTLDVLDIDGDDDLDIFYSNREFTVTSPRGSRWAEQTDDADTWVDHATGAPSIHDIKFSTLVDYDADGDLDIVECASNSAGSILTLQTNTAGDWSAWTATTIPKPDNAGRCHGTATGQINAGGTLDLVVDYSNSVGLSGILWLDGFATTATRGEISSTIGDKFDNPILYDINGDTYLDVVDSEQNDGLGVVWYEHPGCDVADVAAREQSFRNRLRVLMRRGRR